MSALREDSETLTEFLVSSAGSDPIADSYKSGVIMTIRAILDMEFIKENLE